MVNRSWRFGTRESSVAFYGSSQSRTLAADKGTGAPVDMHMESKICSQNVVSQKISLLHHCNGVFQSCHRVGVLGTHIDISLSGTYCVSGDHHTFDKLERIPFHNGTVHECSRVTLVTVADHIALFFFLCSNLFPFPSGGESAAASSAQAGLVHFLHNILRFHIKQHFFQGFKSARCYIFINGFCVKSAAVFQHDTCLFCNERDLIRLYIGLFLFLVEKSVHKTVTHNGMVKYFLAVIRLNLYVLHHFVALLDTHQGTEFTESLASCPLDAHMLFFIMGCKFNGDIGGIPNDLHHLLIDFLGTRSNTSCTGTDKDPASIRLQLLLCRFPALVKFCFV